MQRCGQSGDGTASLESLRGLRLRALLNDLVHDLGPVKAAEELGVDRKTLWRSQGAGELSPRLAGALERMLLERAVEVSGQDRERVRVLEERVAELEGQLQRVLAGTGAGNGGLDSEAVEALRDELAAGLRRLERRVERLESVRVGANAPGGARAARPRSQRRHNDVVAREPGDYDEEVYGAAYLLIKEWRTLWDSHPPTGRGLAWVSARQRIPELEVAMLDEHGLTLPRETAPLKGLDRNTQLGWRHRELAGIRRKRARLERLRWVRRVITLGIWRR